MSRADLPYPAFACQVGIFSRRLICAYWHSRVLSPTGVSAYWHSRGPLAYRVGAYPELTLGTAYRVWMEETSS